MQLWSEGDLHGREAVGMLALCVRGGRTVVGGVGRNGRCSMTVFRVKLEPSASEKPVAALLHRLRADGLHLQETTEDSWAIYASNGRKPRKPAAKKLVRHGSRCWCPIHNPAPPAPVEVVAA